MGNLIPFKEYYCPYCKKMLPVEVHYRNMGMVRIWCTRCQKYVYINKQHVLKD